MCNKRLLTLAMCVGLSACALMGCTGGKAGENKVRTADKTDKTETAQEETELQVFIAASLSGAMEEIAERYKEIQPNTKLVYNADSSGTLQTQIEEGFSCDVFFSAGKKQMDALIEGGCAEEASVIDLLENQVVLITPKGSKTAVTGFADITKAANLALAGESVPVGAYSRQIFEKLGILDDVMAMEINECRNVSAVKEAVKEGANEVGTVYYSDAWSVKDEVDILAYAGAELTDDPIIYPVGLVKNPEATEEQRKAASEFLEYLQTDAAKEIFEKYMFLIYEE